MADQNEKAGVERRRHRRFHCAGIAEVVGFRPHLLFRGKLRDTSQSGGFVETHAHLNLPASPKVEVRFTVNGQRQSALARVMDVRPDTGAGFEFLAADPRLDQGWTRTGPGLDQGWTRVGPGRDQGFQRMIERLDVAEPVKP